MSLQRNVLASLASQLYVTLVGILMVPLYLRYMGAEAYGLVGFFTMLQLWFGLLDAGLTPTLARETARQRGGATDAVTYRRLVRALETIFLAVALAGGVAIVAAGEAIATRWLQSSRLAVGEVVGAIQLMGPIFALRWMAGLYRSALTGAERLQWLGGFNAAVATLRFAGVLPLLMFVGTSPTLFFGYQLAIAALETGWLATQAYRCFPLLPPATRLGLHWKPLRPVLRFSLSIALTSAVWILITQTDKLVLSRVLPLAEYGYFTLAVLVAGAISLLSGPIGNAITPRLARLEAEGAHDQLIRIYRQGTQGVAVIAGAMAITFAFAAEPLLWAWTGDRELARTCAPILGLYALGNGVLAVAAFPYYLQFAKGSLRLHVIGNVAFAVLFVPIVVVASLRWGALGAAWVWLGMNLLSLVAWLPLVHHRFEPGLNARWYTQDTLFIAAAAALAGGAAAAFWPDGGSRAHALAGTSLVGGASLAAAAAASSVMRERARSLWRGWRPACA
ncbi:MAG: oligosaccharide flippase family protein [Rubrivivax sp.]